jgi:hypothetical protein
VSLMRLFRDSENAGCWECKAASSPGSQVCFSLQCSAKSNLILCCICVSRLELYSGKEISFFFPSPVDFVKFFLKMADVVK